MGHFLLEVHWNQVCISSRSRDTGPLAYGDHDQTGCRPTNCPDFFTKDEWPPNLPDLNPVEYRVLGAMLEAYRKLKTKLKTIAELKEALQVIWGNLSQGPIDKAMKDFSKRLKSCVGTGAGHFEHSL